MGSPRAILVVAVLAACGAAFFLLRGRSDGPTAGAERGQGSGPRGPLVDGAPPTLAAGPRVSKDATAESPAAPTAAAVEPATPEELDPADRPADWPTTVADGCRTLSLRVRCVDAITGQPVAARWRLGHPFEDRLRRGEPVNPTASAPGWWLDPRWRAADLRASVLQRPDTLVHDWIVVDAPEGYADVEQFQIHRPVAADIEDVSATVPLWPTIELVLTIRGPDGAPADGARILDLQVVGGPPSHLGGATGRSFDAADADGKVRLKGLPFVPRAEIRAQVGWRSTLPRPPARDATASTPEDRGGTRHRRTPVVVTMPVARIGSFSAEVRVSDATAGWTPFEKLAVEGLAMHAVRDLVPAEAFIPPDPGTAGCVRVRVLAADGRTIARAEVRTDALSVETDMSGLVDLEPLAPGPRQFLVSVPGGFRWSATVEVKSGETVVVETREPEAGRLDVEVADEEGRACPFAPIQISAAGPSGAFDVKDGVQRLDHFTDADGRRSFRRVAPGEVTLETWWRGKIARTKVVVEERGRVTARIVVR